MFSIQNSVIPPPCFMYMLDRLIIVSFRILLLRLLGLDGAAILGSWGQDDLGVVQLALEELEDFVDHTGEMR